jgi:hypothetical protein
MNKNVPGFVAGTLVTPVRDKGSKKDKKRSPKLLK